MIEKSIKDKINKEIQPKVFYLENESHMHAGPRTESHFKAYVVSEKFLGLTKVERQQKVYSLLKEEFSQGLHALTLRLYTDKEHQEKGVSGFVSPDCVHGKKS